MFLVKHIGLSGSEDLFQTPSVRYSPGGDNRPFHSPPATLWYRKADGVEHPLTGGTIFVMNDNGKTVARYDLGASMVPLEADPNQTSFAERFSREKDGGLAAEAVDKLKYNPIQYSQDPAEVVDAARRAPHGRMT